MADRLRDDGTDGNGSESDESTFSDLSETVHDIIDELCAHSNPSPSVGNLSRVSYDGSDDENMDMGFECGRDGDCEPGSQWHPGLSSITALYVDFGNSNFLDEHDMWPDSGDDLGTQDDGSGWSEDELSGNEDEPFWNQTGDQDESWDMDGSYDIQLPSGSADKIEQHSEYGDEVALPVGSCGSMIAHATELDNEHLWGFIEGRQEAIVDALLPEVNLVELYSDILMPYQPPDEQMGELTDGDASIPSHVEGIEMYLPKALLTDDKMADRHGFPIEPPTIQPNDKGFYPFRINTDLTREQHNDLQQLLHDNKDVFAFERYQITPTHLAKFKIDTGDHPPVYQKPYRLSYKESQVVEQEVKKMLAEGIIEATQSPWASPVVLVNKPDGSVRFCCDYRALNAVTKRPQHPLPRIDSIMHSLGQAKWFSAIDIGTVSGRPGTGARSVAGPLRAR
jgi:hypothetical protein